MEEKFGTKGNTVNGIYFTEQEIANCEVIKRLEIEISRQNSNLSEIKQKLAEEAKVVNANAICKFKYGQRKHDWTKLLALKWDTESWFGIGVAVKTRQ